MGLFNELLKTAINHIVKHYQLSIPNKSYWRLSYNMMWLDRVDMQNYFTTSTPFYGKNER